MNTHIYHYIYILWLYIYLSICFENPKESYQYLQFQSNTMAFILVSSFSLLVTAFSGSEKPESHCPLHICLFTQSFCMYSIFSEATPTWYLLTPLELQPPGLNCCYCLSCGRSPWPAWTLTSFVDDIYADGPLILLGFFTCATVTPPFHPLLCSPNGSRTGEFRKGNK